MDMPLKSLRDRLALLEKLRSYDQAEATRRGGFSNSAFINDIFRGHKVGVRGANVAKLALAYETTAAFILGHTDDPEMPGEAALPKSSGGSLDQTSVGEKFDIARFGGTVEAGSFRSIDEFEDWEQENRDRFEPKDDDYPYAKLIHFIVAGDSMNDLQPRPIMPGDRIICLEFESLRGRVPLRDGMVVVVEQTLDGGHHRERSVKQLELYDDRIEFCPRSRNGRHKPIIIPMMAFKDPSEEDRRRVTILGWVRRISNDLPI